MRRLILPLLLLVAAPALAQQKPQGNVKPTQPPVVQPKPKITPPPMPVPHVFEEEWFEEALPKPRKKIEIPPPPSVMPLELVRAKKSFRLTDRVIFVVDTSGSMEGLLQQAVASVQLILMSPVDGFQAGLITYSAYAIRWKGKPEHKHDPKEKCGDHCVRQGWASMPSHYPSLMRYLLTCSADGSTDLARAIRVAMRDPCDRLTVALVTDGDVNVKEAEEAYKKGLAWRKEKKLPPVNFMVWGAGDYHREKLKELARIGGGGLWVHGKKRSGPW